MAEKQEKIVNKIKHATNSGKKTPLGTKPNDECYTSMQDILTEMSYWAELEKFKGKNIICPCDWDITEDENIVGITITYKEDGIDVVGNNVYKAVKSVCFDLWAEVDNQPTITKIDLKEDEIEDFLRDKLTCNFIRTFTQNARRWGIKSITASGYNPATNKGIKFQDIDYSKYDICCTNPPFSLYGEFMNCIVDKIDFIVLAPFLNRVTPNVGLPLMLRKAYLGNNCGIHITFENPTLENAFNTKVVLCDWVASFDDAQKERNKKRNTSGVKYDVYKDDYMIIPGMTMKDMTHPIKVPGCQVPDDYTGWMFSDIGIIDRLSFDEYEWYGTNFKGYYNKVNKEANPFNHPCTDTMLDRPGGKRLFHGIVFRKKPQAEEN